MRSAGTERRALLVSAWGNLFFAALGVGFAMTTGSDAILLDGVFSVIAFVMALLTIKVVRLVEQPDDEHFHFGYASFEPLLNTIKGLIIFGVCALSLVSAVLAILQGGRDLEVGWAVVYALVACAGAGILAVVQGRSARKTSSPVLEVDAESWRVDSLMSAGVGVTFLLAFWLSTTQWAAWVAYVDPVLVGVLSLIMIGLPLGIIRRGVGELLLESPGKLVEQQVEARFNEVTERYQFEKSVLRTVRIGRRMVLMAHVVVSPDFQVARVADLDAIRSEIEQGILDLHPGWMVDVIFVEDEKFAY